MSPLTRRQTATLSREGRGAKSARGRLAILIAPPQAGGAKELGCGAVLAGARHGAPS